jgi:hypothetical protein
MYFENVSESYMHFSIKLDLNSLNLSSSSEMIHVSNNACVNRSIPSEEFQFSRVKVNSSD